MLGGEAGETQAAPIGRDQGAAASSDKVVYILDQDLIRFGKFAIAILAIFVTVGVFLWGFDIKQAAKEARDSADNAVTARKQAGEASEEIKATRKQISDARDEINRAKDEIRKNLADSAAQVNDARTVAAAGLERMKTLLAQAEEDEGKIHSKLVVSTTTVTATVTSPTTTAKTKAAAAPKAELPGVTVPQVTAAYEFPEEFTGKGQRIALIELGGGIRDTDLTTYFQKLGIPKPKVSWVSVSGATNSPSDDPFGADSQVAIDIEVAGAAAPGAEIVVYFCRNTNQGFLEGILEVIKQTENRPGVLSIAWGQPEPTWSKAMLEQMNEALQRAALLGITVVCAAGDSGVTDGLADGKPHVDFPASSPWVLACGGTHLQISGKTIISEVAWNGGLGATGGGVSEVFPRPDWQTNASVPPRQDGQAGRGVPDVAALASPDAGYRFYVHGRTMLLGGTSVAAPLWAGLIARMNQALGRNVGFINPALYKTIGPGGALRSITEGNNGIKGIKGYSAGPGWNPCTGWGSPNGRKLLEAIRPKAL